MLTLSGMRAFVAVVETGSFTAAAARQNATQSGVSQQISRLEARLGIELLTRGPQGAVPTPAGKHLYQRAVQIMRDLAATESGLTNFERGVAGSIRLGLMPALTRSISGPVQRRFMAEHPNVRVVVTERVSSDLIEAVAAGRIDLGIVPAFDAPDTIRVTAVGSTSEVLVHRGRNHPNHMRALHTFDMTPLRLILQSAGNIRREAVLSKLRAARVEIVDLLDLDSMFGTLEFVASGDYVTVLPAIMMAPEIDSRELCLRPIREPAMELEMVAIEPSSRGESLIAPLLIELFKAELDAFNRRLDARCWT